VRGDGDLFGRQTKGLNKGRSMGKERAGKRGGVGVKRSKTVGSFRCEGGPGKSTLKKLTAAKTLSVTGGENNEIWLEKRRKETMCDNGAGDDRGEKTLGGRGQVQKNA